MALPGSYAPEVDETAPQAEFAPHRRRTRWFVGGGIVALLVAVPVGLVLFGAEAPEEQRKGDVVSSYRATATTAPAGASTSTDGPRAALRRPAAGVYEFRGEGNEETSFPPLTEAQGPDMPASVTLRSDGCWTLRLHYNTHHWQEWSYCTRDGVLTETGGQTFQRRVYPGLEVDNTSTFTCDEPIVLLDPEPPAKDAPRDGVCTGSSDVIAGETIATSVLETVGTESRVIDGDAVDVVHLQRTETYTGAQSGGGVTDIWVVADTGMPVQNRHEIRVRTDTPFGAITYTESSDTSILSLRPET